MKAGVSHVRPPVAAGTFYSADPAVLRETVQTLLARASPETAAGPAIAALVPHAALDYSGLCAASVFARIEVPSTVVIIGPDHHGLSSKGGGASVCRAGAFATPLGDVPVDKAFAATLLATCPLLADDPAAHVRDHAIEVELPFLIARAAPRHTSIVPILLMWDDWKSCADLGAALASVVRGRNPGTVLLLASSDMTHFEPAHAALRHDRPALDAIVRLNGERLLRICSAMRISMCGRAAAAVVIEAARQLGATQARVVEHTHSGVASGDWTRVVSYAGVVIR